MVDLPPEIWYLITRHVPPTTLVKLMPLNRTFMELALNEKYKELQMVQLTNPLFTKLQGLKDSNNTQRVRKLHLEIQVLYELEDYEKIYGTNRVEEPYTGLRMHAMRLYQKIFGREEARTNADEDRPFSSKEISQLLLDVLPLLTNVTNLSVELCNDVSPEMPTLYLAIAWRTYAQNLQELRLSLHPNLIEAVLPLDVSFPLLSSLNIQITNQNLLKGSPESSLRALTAFINKFQTTLRDLHILHGSAWDISHLYRDLGFFPQLTSFNVAPYQFSQAGYVLSFIQKHADILQNLVYLSHPNSRSGLSELVLNNLKTLTLSVHYVTYPNAWWTQPCPFFKSIGRTLRHLDINGPLTPDELTSLLSSLSGEGSIALEEISLSVQSLSVDILTMISSKLPHLQSLDLRIHDVISIGAFPESPTEFFPYDRDPGKGQHQFAMQLKERFANIPWELKDITIKRRSCCGDLILWGLMGLCAKCFPSITSFAAQGNKTIPHPPNTKPAGGNTRCSGAVCAYGKDGNRGNGRNYMP